MKASTRVRFFYCAAFAAVLIASSAAVSLGSDKSAAKLAELLNSRLNEDWRIPSRLPDVVACDQKDVRVVIFKARADWNDPASVVWEWRPSESLENKYAKWFNNVSECKPALGGTAVLVAASSGGVALVRLSDKKILFLGYAGGNTHSIARFPDGNIVAASSTGAYLSLFAVAPVDEESETVVETPLFKKYEFPGAHGVVWDAKRKILWAHGDSEIAGYEYVGTKEAPDLKKVFSAKLVGTQIYGHDLCSAPGYDALITTGSGKTGGVNVFDPETRTFATASETRSVKSVSVSSRGAVIVQIPDEEWWSDSIYLDGQKKRKIGQCDGARFYKARWFVPDEFSEPK